MFKGVLVHEQHDFRSGKSTVTNLSLLTNHAYSAFSRGQKSIVSTWIWAMPLTEPFMVSKLQVLGVCSSLLNWFESYVSGTTLRVRFASALSRSITVPSGVFQGFLLGPFLLSIFIYDIGESLASKIILFADDV